MDKAKFKAQKITSKAQSEQFILNLDRSALNAGDSFVGKLLINVLFLNVPPRRTTRHQPMRPANNAQCL